MYRPASTWGRKPYPTKNQTRLGDNRRPDYHTWKSTASTSTTTSVRAEAATALAEQFYMDDLIFGGDDEQRVTEVAHEIYRILKGANFHLCKWKSNSLYIQGLDSEAFLAAFRRFTARRGKPRRMVSDNGTTFHGADNDLRELYSFLAQNLDELTSSFSNQGIEWKFIPVYSPHMGGLWEAAVKSCKFHLKRVLGQSLLTYEEYSTVLVQIEGILNSRPLCPIPYTDNEISQVLTPAHFIIGKTPVALPDYDYDDIPTNKLKYYQQLQQMYQSFWRGWSRDYIGTLQQRTKWRSSKGPSLTVGTVVLIKDDHLPPCYWKLARITDTHAGRDGIVRVATMKTSTGNIIKRSFAKICPLPISLE